MKIFFYGQARRLVSQGDGDIAARWIFSLGVQAGGLAKL